MEQRWTRERNATVARRKRMNRELRTLTEKYLKCELPDEETLREAEKNARRKLKWIISREGDANGERKKPYYLAQLIAEAVRQEAMSRYYLLDFIIKSECKGEKKSRSIKETALSTAPIVSPINN